MTFHHLVAITWTQSIDESNISAFSEALDQLSVECAELLHAYAHGRDVSSRDVSSDYGISATFHDPTGYAEYDVHPAHIRAKELLSEFAAKYTVVQFEA
ncbi:Dabb family protein (plasmid) [Rhodococcus qingshengii]|uniref:Dabb family protein n=1 Tax=Rhodococcus TaxID=1827 RepID=UPI0006D00D0E|nr:MULTISPECIES: Dabb family protein [Rhodococcus]AZI66052.1 Dabb family protein [Rhodococcus sp. NJ-530]BDQ24077.1 Dabb family protein [Rhodococcus qingshengii]